MMNRMRGAAVPIFILMSFYLMEKTFFDANADKIKKRAWRLLFPYFSCSIYTILLHEIIEKPITSFLKKKIS